MARPREFDPQAALQTAIEVFWEKGYFDGSVDEVVKRSGVAKYGIYGTFGTKRELFIQALHQYAKDRRHDMQRPIREPGASLPQIRKFFKNAPKRVTHPDSKRRGCLLCNTGVEVGVNDEEVRAIVNDFFDEAAETLKGCLHRAIANKEVAPDIDVGRTANFLATEFRVLLMLASSGVALREIENHVTTALRVLD
jgi:TetR/AcrR family transcriptional repressor of nem operon